MSTSLMQDRLDAAMQACPLLTGFGLDVYFTYTQDTAIHAAEFARQRAELAADLAMFTALYDWLAQVGTRQTINPRYSSYRLKHIAEDCLGAYMGNGPCIAAAIARGFQWRRCDPTHPNVWFNMSGKDLARLEHEGQARKWGHTRVEVGSFQKGKGT